MSSDLATPVHLAVIGGGPRALGILERMSASAPLLAGRALVVDVVEPHMPGAGRIWDLTESPLLLMNSRAQDVTIFTDETVRMDGPVVAGPTLAAWAEEIRAGRIAQPTAATDLRAEIDGLRADSFASRRLQALYLEWFTGRVLAALPGTIEVRVHRTLAEGVEDLGVERSATAERATGERATAAEGVGAESAHAAEGPWRVLLADGGHLEADLLLVTVGHTDARPTPARHALAAFARRHGGAYVPPSAARDVDLSGIAAGQDVIVRGMGLAFVDLLSLLTEGRGGRFEPCPGTGRQGRLRYLASGEEPHVWVGSRRGAPYHSKVADESVPAGPGDLVHLTAQAIAAREDAEGRVRFREDVLPLIDAEIRRAYPPAPPVEKDAELRWLDDPLAWLVADDSWVPRDLLPPCDARRLTRDAVVHHLENDLRSRTGADTHDERALFQVLLRITGALVDLLPADRLHDDSSGDYPAWWHSVFSFVDSGPPPHRLEQLLALERAGVVTFLGPRLRVRTDETTGRFVAEGGTGTRVETSALIDAFLPEQTLGESTNVLLRSFVGADASTAPLVRGREAAAAPGRLEIDAGQHMVRPDGTPYATIWAAGPWTSELPLGAFTRPRTNAPVFRRNDALARSILRTAAGLSVSLRPRVAASSVPGTRERPTIAILGPGRIGTALARLAVRRGLDVRIAGRQGPATLRERVPAAHPIAVEQLGTCDVVVLAVPLHVALATDPAALAGAVVIDATNAWGDLDAARLADRSGSTSEIVAEHFAQSAVVKTLNHIGYHDVETHEAGLRHRGAPRALALVGDHADALRRASGVLEALGFEPVVLGALADGRALEPDGDLFTGWATRAELEARLAHRRERATAA